MGQNSTSQNPVVVLNELVQRVYKQSITTQVVSMTGPKHQPTVTVTITLPKGSTFTAEGKNQRVARQRAAAVALQLFTA